MGQINHVLDEVQPSTTCTARGARFTKYLTTILRLSYDNAKVTIDLRRTSNLPNILRRTLLLLLLHLLTPVVITMTIVMMFEDTEYTRLFQDGERCAVSVVQPSVFFDQKVLSDAS